MKKKAQSGVIMPDWYQNYLSTYGTNFPQNGYINQNPNSNGELPIVNVTAQGNPQQNYYGINQPQMLPIQQVQVQPKSQDQLPYKGGFNFGGGDQPVSRKRASNIARGIAQASYAIGDVFNTIGDIKRGIIKGGAAIFNSLIPETHNKREELPIFAYNQDPYGAQQYNNIFANGGYLPQAASGIHINPEHKEDFPLKTERESQFAHNFNGKKAQYGTQLSPKEEKDFQTWRGKLPKSLQSETDYDLKGLWKSNPNIKPSKDLHFPDTYKLPNHPTFSNESIYYIGEPGIGGYWNEDTYVPNPQIGPSASISFQNGGKLLNFLPISQPLPVIQDLDKMREAPLVNEKNAEKNVRTFYKNYLNSPNYRQRLVGQGYENPDQVIKDRLNNLKNSRIKNSNEWSGYTPKTNIIDIDKSDLKRYNIDEGTLLSHEISHAAGSITNSSNNLNLNRNDVNAINLRNNLFPNRSNFHIGSDEYHDSLPAELKADMDGLRYLLKRDGIYDTGTQQFNQDILNKARARYKSNGNVKRLLDRTSDADLIWLMNNIAQVNTPQSNIPYAENGKTLTANKAKEILKDGTIRNKKISEKQRKYFGYIAGGGTPKAVNGAVVTDYGFNQVPNLTPAQETVLQEFIPYTTPTKRIQSASNSDYGYYTPNPNGTFAINIDRHLLDRNAPSGYIGNTYSYGTNRAYGFEGLYGNRNYQPTMFMDTGYNRYFQNGGNLPINDTGYLSNTPTSLNPVNIIPSNYITTQGMGEPIIANGQYLQPNTGNYLFPTNSVLESKAYQVGQELDLSPEEIKALKAQGYEFE